MRRGATLQVIAEVSNRGGRAAEETVQLYVHDRVAELTRPIRELRGIQRVALAAGETRTVAFDLHEADLAYVHPDLASRADVGEFEVWIAPKAEAGTPARFTLA